MQAWSDSSNLPSQPLMKDNTTHTVLTIEFLVPGRDTMCIPFDQLLQCVTAVYQTTPCKWINQHFTFWFYSSPKNWSRVLGNTSEIIQSTATEAIRLIRFYISDLRVLCIATIHIKCSEHTHTHTHTRTHTHTHTHTHMCICPEQSRNFSKVKYRIELLKVGIPKLSTSSRLELHHSPIA